METRRGIAKVQVPLAGNGDMYEAMIYFIDRRPFFMPITPKLLALMRKRPKAYFLVEKRGDEVEIIERAPDQSW
jgi:hypothetical protein